MLDTFTSNMTSIIMNKNFIINKGVVLGILLCFVVTGQIPATSAQGETRDIRVAIYGEDLIVSSGLLKFLKLFDGYKWTVGNTTYRFVVTQ